MIRRLGALVRKESLEGVRNLSLLFVLAIPLAIGALARMDTVAQATVAHTEGGDRRLLVELREAVADTVDVAFVRVRDGTQARQMVLDRSVDVGLVVPPEVGTGEPVHVISRESRELRDLRGDFVSSAVELAVRRLAADDAAPLVTSDVLPAPPGVATAVFREIGQSGFGAIAGMVMFAVFVCLLALPSSMAEESEKKTLDALLLTSRFGEVVAGKAIFAFLLVAAGLPVGLAVSGLSVADPLLFAAAMGALTITIAGIGLFVGVLARTQREVGVIQLPVAMPLFAAGYAAGIPINPTADRILDFIPTSQAARLAVDAVTGQPLFDRTAMAFAVIAAWGAVAYALLIWRLRRRES